MSEKKDIPSGNEVVDEAVEQLVEKLYAANGVFLFSEVVDVKGLLNEGDEKGIVREIIQRVGAENWESRIGEGQECTFRCEIYGCRDEGDTVLLMGFLELIRIQIPYPPVVEEDSIPYTKSVPKEGLTFYLGLDTLAMNTRNKEIVAFIAKQLLEDPSIQVLFDEFKGAVNLGVRGVMDSLEQGIIQHRLEERNLPTVTSAKIAKIIEAIEVGEIDIPDVDVYGNSIKLFTRDDQAPGGFEVTIKPLFQEIFDHFKSEKKSLLFELSGITLCGVVNYIAMKRTRALLKTSNAEVELKQFFSNAMTVFLRAVGLNVVVNVIKVDNPESPFEFPDFVVEIELQGEEIGLN